MNWSYKVRTINGRKSKLQLKCKLHKNKVLKIKIIETINYKKCKQQNCKLQKFIEIAIKRRNFHSKKT